MRNDSWLVYGTTTEKDVQQGQRDRVNNFSSCAISIWGKALQATLQPTFNPVPPFPAVSNFHASFDYNSPDWTSVYKWSVIPQWLRPATGYVPEKTANSNQLILTLFPVSLFMSIIEKLTSLVLKACTKFLFLLDHCLQLCDFFPYILIHK